jgi:hypothetical protein
MAPPSNIAAQEIKYTKENEIYYRTMDGLEIVRKIQEAMADPSEDCFVKYFFSYQVFRDLFFGLKNDYKFSHIRLNIYRDSEIGADIRNVSFTKDTIKNYFHGDEIYELYENFKYSMIPLPKGCRKNDFFNQFGGGSFGHFSSSGTTVTINKLSNPDDFLSQLSNLRKKHFPYLIAIKCFYSFAKSSQEIEFDIPKMINFLLEVNDNCEKFNIGHEFLNSEFREEGKLISLLGPKIWIKNHVPNRDFSGKDLFVQYYELLFDFMRTITNTTNRN